MTGIKPNNEFDFFLPLQSGLEILSDSNVFGELETPKSVPFIPI